MSSSSELHPWQQSSLIAPYVPFVLPRTGYQPYSLISRIADSVSVVFSCTIALRAWYQFVTQDPKANFYTGGKQWFFRFGAQSPRRSTDVFVRGRSHGRRRACWRKPRAGRIVPRRTDYAADKVEAKAFRAGLEKKRRRRSSGHGKW